MSANTDPPIIKLEDVPWHLDGASGSSTFGDTKAPAPTSGNDEVKAMIARLETNDEDVSYQEVVALLRKQADELAWRRQEMAKLIEIVTSQAAQIAELRVLLERDPEAAFNYETQHRQHDEIIAKNRQIAELQKATAQTSVSPTPADSARPETE